MYSLQESILIKLETKTYLKIRANEARAVAEINLLFDEKVKVCFFADKLSKHTNISSF